MKRAKLTGKGLKDLRALVYRRSQGLCDWCGKGVREDAFEMHHRLLKSRLGPDAPWNCVVLHSSCHAWITRHPERAKELGFEISRYDPNPDSVPMWLHQQYAVIPDGGGWAQTLVAA